jgi:hypothetical protein
MSSFVICRLVAANMLFVQRRPVGRPPGVLRCPSREFRPARPSTCRSRPPVRSSCRGRSLNCLSNLPKSALARSQERNGSHHRRAENAVCLNGVGHDDDSPNAASFDAANPNRACKSEPCAGARHRQTVNEWPVPTGHRVQRPVQRACNGV